MFLVIVKDKRRVFYYTFYLFVPFRLAFSTYSYPSSGTDFAFSTLRGLIAFNQRVKGEAVWDAGFFVDTLQIVPDSPD